MAQQGISPAAIEFARMNDWRVDAIGDLRTNATLLRFFTNGTNPVAVNAAYAGSIDQLVAWFDREGVAYKWPPKKLLVEPEQNFANHPKSIGEFKAERDEDSRTWAPRDALISLLREIDSGQTKPTDLVICYIERDPEDGGGTKSRHLNATSDLPSALGLLNRIQFRLNTGGPA